MPLTESLQPGHILAQLGAWSTHRVGNNGLTTWRTVRLDSLRDDDASAADVVGRDLDEIDDQVLSDSLQIAHQLDEFLRDLIEHQHQTETAALQRRVEVCLEVLGFGYEAAEDS